MKIAIGTTGHQIADTVAQALIAQFGNDASADVFMGYGILRGMAESFHRHDHWFNIDRGYTNPAHFDGNYRISYRGTQLKWRDGIPRKPVSIKLEPMRYHGDYVLICPPTQAVCDFFGISLKGWEMAQVLNCYQACMPARWRHKGSTIPIKHELANAKAVITFNSSIGWQALQMGIPVISDVNHSAVGSFYGSASLSELMENLQNKPDNRIELFEAMEAHQFKLSDASGLWELLSHYISGLDSMGVKPLPQMSSPTASANVPHPSLASIFSSTGN